MFNHFLKINHHTCLYRNLLAAEVFDAVTSPKVLSGLATLPLTKLEHQSLDGVQRKMFRLIVGWVGLPDEDWSETMSQMNRRMPFATATHKCKPWSCQVFKNNFRVATKIFHLRNSWAAATTQWNPTSGWQQTSSNEPKRRQGRPSKRWDDNFESFANHYFQVPWGLNGHSGKMHVYSLAALKDREDSDGQKKKKFRNPIFGHL